MWLFKTRIGWESTYDRRMQADTFEEYVINVLRYRPRGMASSMFRRYLFTGDTCVDYIGKQESLADDLVRALRQAGEEFDEDALRATPMRNTSSVGIDPSQHPVSRELVAQFLEREWWACETFGYR